MRNNRRGYYEHRDVTEVIDPHAARPVEPMAECDDCGTKNDVRCYGHALLCRKCGAVSDEFVDHEQREDFHADGF